MLLGDFVHKALERVGVTPELVSAWIGDCGCVDRRQRLNRLHLWARQTVDSSAQKAREQLDKFIKTQEERRRDRGR